MTSQNQIDVFTVDWNLQQLALAGPFHHNNSQLGLIKQYCRKKSPTTLPYSDDEQRFPLLFIK